MHAHEAMALLKRRESLARAENARLATEARAGRAGVFRRGYAAVRDRLAIDQPILTAGAEGRRAAA